MSSAGRQQRQKEAVDWENSIRRIVLTIASRQPRAERTATHQRADDQIVVDEHARDEQHKAENLHERVQ